MSTTTKKKDAETPAKSMFDGGDYRIMDVAEACHLRYQRARDLILARKFGEIKKDKDGKIVVAKKAVDTFIKARGA
jgi:hypothetical protein